MHDMAAFKHAITNGEVFINPSMVFKLHAYSLDEPTTDPWTVITSNAGATELVRGTVMQVWRTLRGER